MIADNPGNRFGSVADVLYEAENIQYHIERNYNPISPVAQVCRYCGQGNYTLMVDQVGRNGSIDVTDFGFTPVSGNLPWRIFRCHACGHLEFFRVDPWWGPRNPS